jgi:hypothetical protein
MSDPTVTAEHRPDDPTATAAQHSIPSAPVEPADGPPGYDLLARIGVGGMGEVYRARDRSLARDIALKFLHPRYGPDSDLARRFEEEARITARLQHPGIPPVHQVGRLADGRPFLAMKLIDGRALDALLADRPTPAADRGRFVAVFEKVCEALGYAHSRRIIHRDLKPANIMVGEFGEVQVMDWGLAKELGAADRPADESDPALSDRGDVTRAGSTLGTPAFIPPEQAAGALDWVTERSDVFGLGAILCVILTGRPPFDADTGTAALGLAAAGAVSGCFARLDACGAEPDLVALCKRCLAPDPAGRPADAGAVAAAVATFRTEAERRAREAETARATEAVLAAEKAKRRRAQRIIITGFLLVGVVVAWWSNDERKSRKLEQQAEKTRRAEEDRDRLAERQARKEVAEREVESALREVQALREQGLRQTDEPERWAATLVAARAAWKQAGRRLVGIELAADALKRIGDAGAQLDADERDRALLAELDRLAEENDLRFFLHVPGSNTARRYAAAFRRVGINAEDHPAADTIDRIKRHRFRERLTIALRQWQLSCPEGDDPSVLVPLADGVSAVAGGAGGVVILHPPTTRARLTLVLDGVTEEPFEREWWAAIGRNDSKAVEALFERPELRAMSPRRWSALADGLTNNLLIDNAVAAKFLGLAYQRFPGEFWVNAQLAVNVNRIDVGPQPALRHLSAAVAARPTSVISRVCLGELLLQQDPADPTGLGLVRGAVELAPDSPWPHLILAGVAVRTGDTVEGLRLFEEAVRRDPDSFPFLVMFQSALEYRSDRAPSEAELVAFYDRLIAVHPDHPGGYAARAGFRLNRDGHAALADYRRARELFRPDTDPTLREMVNTQLGYLELLVAWRPKLPDVLAGKLTPTSGTEFADLAEYCATFERKPNLAVRFARAALAADPNLATGPAVVPFAAWAVRAGLGEGDGADLAADDRAALRRQGLAWLRAAVDRPKATEAVAVRLAILARSDLHRLQSPRVLAELPPAERTEWEAFWSKLGIERPLDRAPPPREVK